jgi:predicted esterase
VQEGAGKIWEDLVPGAKSEPVYLKDLTTAGTLRTGHTNLHDWYGLHAQGSRAQGTRPSRDVPGLQIDGYFPDDSSTTRARGNVYGNKKYPNDSQFVVRLPNPVLWNGKLVVTGAPGIRGQYANDFVISDFVLDKGYAFASTDKGNSGAFFYLDGKEPGGAVAEWHHRVTQLTRAAKDAAERYYGRKPRRTYITGISNGGYLTRYALENSPQLYDGGVDWEGVLWRPEGPNLLTFLPRAIKIYQAYVAAKNEEERQKAREAMAGAGFPPGSEGLWYYHNLVYWNLTQSIFRLEFDPDYSGPEADYDYAKRINEGPQAQALRDAVKKVSLTGNIGKPLITLHGTLDALLPITKTSDVYAKLIDDAGKTHLHRYYTIEGGNHTDSYYDYPELRDKLRPILPCYRAAFEELEKWVEKRNYQPPQTHTVPKLEGEDVINSCSLLMR